MTDFALPVAFHFTVSLSGSSSAVDGAFQEVSGLEAEIQVEEVVEGGENRFVHRLPKPVKHSNLRLKRGLATESSELVKWCKSTIENDFSQPIKPQSVVISLCDEEGDPSATWSITNAYPVKWEVGGFDAMKNEIAVETIELAFNTLKRTK
ncbi:MAG: phage tail protein [Pseudomonadota bacterium]